MVRLIAQIVINIFILLLLPSLAQAYTETIYVCQGGSGSAVNAGTCSGAYDDSALTSSGAWSSNVSADGKIGPGDLVLFMDDGGAFTSNMDTKANGLAERPITFSVAPADTVTWNGRSGDVIDINHQYITIDGDDRLTINGADTANILKIIDASGSTNSTDYLTVKDTILVGPGSRASYGAMRGILLEDDNFTITGNEIKNLTIGIFVSFDNTGTHSGLIDDNYIHDMDQPNDVGQFTSQDCILLKGQNSNASYMDFGDVTVSRNKLTNWLDDAIDMYGAYGVTFEYNDVGPNNVAGYSGLECNGIKMAGSVAGTGDGNIARYNYIHDFSNNCEGQGILSNGNGGGATGMFIYGNLIENLHAASDSQNHGIDLVANEVRGEGNIKVYNNTITNVGGWAFRNSQNQRAGSEVYNNIFDGDAGDAYINSNNTAVTNGGYNILVNSSAFSDSGGEYDCGSPCTDLGNTDPRFWGAANGQYWLRSDSPAIDAGTHLNNSSVKALFPGSVWPTDVVVVDPQFDGTRGEIGAFAYNNSKP